MKRLPEKKAFDQLRMMQRRYAEQIRGEYEHRALPCSTCATPGACCLDAHFVNVHVSKLEARLIRSVIDGFDGKLRQKVMERTTAVIEMYKLSPEGDTYSRTFACPLFEKGVGCLVHETGKPVACTTHACYENAEDLPPNELQFAQEQLIDDLNSRTYGRPNPWLPLPLAIRKVMSTYE
jgi:hypothetical protein